jgi:hypothetical protein
MTPDEPDPRVPTRAGLLPEEESVGSDDPRSQADQILQESDERTLDRNAAPSSRVEHRRTEETVDPT